MKMKLRFLYIIICCSLITATLKADFDDNFDQDVYKKLNFIRTIDKTNVFNHHDRARLETLFLSEPLIRPIPRQGGEFGYDKVQLTDIHIKALEAAVQETALDIGAGHGYFMAKLLAADAKHVTGLEIIKGAHDEIPNTIAEVQNILGKDYSNRYSTINDSFIKHSFKGAKKFKVISSFNVFHFLTPTEARNGLNKVKKILSKDGKFFFIVNAPTNQGFTSFDAYKINRDSGIPYPGHILASRNDLQEYYINSEGQPIKLIRKISTTFIGSERIRKGAKSEPGKFINGDFSGSTWGKGDKTRRFTINIKETFFAWDKTTAERMFAEAGLKIVDIYYINAAQERVDNLSDEEMKNYAHHLAVEACHQESDPTEL